MLLKTSKPMIPFIDVGGTLGAHSAPLTAVLLFYLVPGQAGESAHAFVLALVAVKAVYGVSLQRSALIALQIAYLKGVYIQLVLRLPGPPFQRRPGAGSIFY